MAIDNERQQLKAMLQGAGLKVSLPSPLEPIELGSFDNGGRSWQITLSDWSSHIPG